MLLQPTKALAKILVFIDVRQYILNKFHRYLIILLVNLWNLHLTVIFILCCFIIQLVSFTLIRYHQQTDYST
jgi:hypothetical protein